MQHERWVLNTIEDAVVHARRRNTQGIRVAIDPLSNVVMDKGHLGTSVQEHVRCLNVIKANCLYASLAVKLSALGMYIDHETCRETLLTLADDALKRSLQLEIDMEGRSSVDFSISCAIDLADEGYRTTLAVQAYLDRTPDDINRLIKEGVSIRLVKGAYQGDVKDPDEICRRMISISDDLLARGKRFCLATHDPVIIDHVVGKVSSKKKIEFGMLMGLGDSTKINLSTGDWEVVEYVPFGKEYGPYVHRREVYLKDLEKQDLSPAP